MKTRRLRWFGIALMLPLFFSVPGGMPSAQGDVIYTDFLYMPVVLDNPPKEMVYVPEGTFQMGCDTAASPGPEVCPADQLPLHTVYLDAFFIDRLEVTNIQYAACVAAGACQDKGFTWSNTRPDYANNPLYADYPVIFTHSIHAATYCAWLGKRLPTEAEWEKAARGSSDTRYYPWGAQALDCTLANVGNDDCVNDTTRVGSYPLGASPYGALDMIGNVSEWVSDWYQADYYSTSPADNPQGPLSGIDRVRRGGSWLFAGNNVADYYLSGRDHWNSGYGDFFAGFRCAVTSGP